MHEAILTRGDFRARKWHPKDQEAIMVPENCVLVHGTICHEASRSAEGQVLCIIYLVHHEGADKIIAWLEGMDKIMKSSLPQTKIRSVKNVLNGMSAR